MGDRIHSIDTLRAVAIVFVVIAHTEPFLGFGSYGNHVFFVLDTIGQFDVPFFFAASGYFLATKLTPDNARSYAAGTVRKLASIYLFGLLLYLPVLVLRTAAVAVVEGRNVPSAIVSRLVEGLSPVELLYYGDSIAFHLWFLTALIFAICFVALLVRFDKARYLFPVAAVAHVFGLLAENYPMLVDVPVPTRDALFFGLFYVALGFQIRSMDWSPDEDRSRLYLGAFLVVLAVQLAEQYAVGYVVRALTLGQEVYTTNYTVATVFLVLTLFAYALSNPGLGEGTILPDLGEYAVGIYLAHLPVVHVLRVVNGVLVAVVGVDLTTSVLWHLLMTPVVLVLSLGVYLLAGRVGVIEIGGDHTPRLNRIRSRLGSGSGAGSASD